MTKRCKVGDIAIVVNDMEMPINNGAMVKILRTANPDDYEIEEICWECEALSVIQHDCGYIAYPGDDGVGYRDRELRPIRDSDREDETLTWAGKPEEVTA